MLLKRSFLWIILLGMLLVLPVHAGPPVITVVRGQDFPPYHYLDENGEETGFIVDIIREAGRQIPLTVRFSQYAWSRCLELVRTGRADAMMNLFKTKERTTFMIFSNNILAREKNVLFKRKQTPLAFTGDLSVLIPYRLGAILNYSYGPGFDSTEFPLMIRLETEADLIKSLVNKRCEVIVGNAIVIRRLMRQMGVADQVDTLLPAVSDDPLYLGFSKKLGHQDLADRFSEALALLKATGAHAAILKKYGL